ncbi:MAG: DUF2975 domain-containing protein [Spirochaetia bacterium]|nr:DUF2975 domain-containing protein [Spirochaetia bacterium]
MNESNYVKYKNLSRYLYKIINLLFWLSIFLAAIFFVVSIILLIIPIKSNLLLSPSNNSISLSPDNIIRFNLENISVNLMSLKEVFIYSFFSFSIVSIFLAFITKQLKYIFFNVINNEPFNENNSKSILFIGYSVIIGAIVFPISKAIVIDKIINGFNFSNVNVVYSINIEGIFIGILLIILSSIFHFGSYLQNEHDSTI